MEKNKSQQFYERTGMTNCLEKETAFCTVECPFHFDIPAFMDKIQRGSFNNAYKDFKNAVGFPRIALELCDERCKTVCPRKIKDSPLQLKFLEKASANYAKNTNPTEYNIPAKSKTVAIVGTGICGMACALRLCEKKYHIEIFEKKDRIGGHLWEVMDPSIFLDDFEKQFMHENFELHLNTEVMSIESIAEKYDAVFIATGNGGLKAIGNGIFLGGALLGKNDLDSLVDGLEASKQIEAYLKTGIMNNTVNQYCTHMPLPDMGDLDACYTKMQRSEGFTEEESMLEAGRCLRCKCDACRKKCDLLLHYKKSPLKAIEEIRATTEVRGVLGSGNMTIATKMIASCSQCGLCTVVCPENIDFKTIILEARRVLHNRGSLPWAFNDFFLRDMSHANTKGEVIIDPHISKTPEYIFFPGCQLGASDPRYVIDSYRMLRKHYPDTVLINRCCGAPAVWTGDENLQNQVFREFKEKWLEFNKPEIIFACPTCKKIFEDYLPELKGVFLYSVFNQLEIKSKTKQKGSAASVFDPCNARSYPEVQSHVRILSEKAGYHLKPLKHEKNFARCCGFGGNSSIVNPKKKEETVRRRIELGKDIYITYCINCRDIFAEYGKESVHILDVLFDINNEKRIPPTITQRKRNREKLKKLLMEEFDKFDCENEERSRMKIVINDTLKEKLNKRLIYEDDVMNVINYCESTGNYIKNLGKETYIGYKEIGKITYWIEYKHVRDGIELVNAYSHRITIKG